MSENRFGIRYGTNVRSSYFALIRRVLVGMVVALTVSSVQVAAAGSRPKSSLPGLTGVIRDLQGKPLNGVAVSVRSTEQTFTTSVYTDDRGEYVFPLLIAGKYQLWAQAVQFGTERAELKLNGIHTARRDLTLRPLANYEAQLTGVEWYDALPDDTVNHRRLKQVLYVSCTGCHGLDVVLQNRFDVPGWKAIIEAMQSAWYSGWRGASALPASDLRWEAQIMRYHEDELAQYLTEMRGPAASPMTLRPMERPSGEAARVVVTEYDLPISARENELPWYNGSDWMDGPSTGMHGIVGTHDVVVDSAGRAWVSHSGGRSTFESNRAMLKLDPASGDMTAYQLLDGKGRMIPIEQISSIDSKGDIWMHSDEAFIRLDTRTEQFRAYSMPKVMGGMENSTDVDSKGRVWANARFGAARFDPDAPFRTDVAYPGWALFQQQTPGDGITYGIATDADDNPWWSESYVDKVAMRDMKTGQLTEIDMRDPDYAIRKELATPADLAFYESIGAGTWSSNSASPLPYANMPRRLAADKGGDTVWVPNWAQSNIAEIQIHTMKVTYHRLPIHVHPYKTIVDRQHNVWTDTSLADAALKFNPASGEWTVYRLPSHGCGSRHMGFDDFRGEAWMACDQSGKVARIQFRTAADVEKLKAARSASRR
jgi:streptogramin lyase